MNDNPPNRKQNLAAKSGGGKIAGASQRAFKDPDAPT